MSLLTPDDRAAIRTFLTERFQIEELEVLAFDLGVFDASIRRASKLVFALDLFQ